MENASFDIFGKVQEARSKCLGAFEKGTMAAREK
jgi:hypothetical protein